MTPGAETATERSRPEQAADAAPGGPSSGAAEGVPAAGDGSTAGDGPTDRAPAAGSSPAWRRRSAAAARLVEPTVLVVLVAGSFALRLVLALPDGGPILTDDGLGYLGNARWIAGVSEPDLRFSHFYSMGYSVVIAPLYLLGLTPSELIVGVQVVNAAFATAIVVPLAALARRARPGLGIRVWWIALVASLTPALVLQPALEWPETLLPLLFAVWAVVTFRLLERRRLPDALVLAALAVALFATHERTAPVVAVTALVLVAAALHDRHHRHRLAVHLAALAAVPVGVVAVQRWADAMVEVLWRGHEPTNAGRAGGMAERLASGDWEPLLHNVLGQTWYLAAGTAGAVALGAGVVGLRTWPALRGAWRVVDRRRDGTVWGGVPWAAVLMAAGGVLLAGVVFTGGTRVDHAVYGRYNEAWSPVLMVAGLAWWCGRSRLGRLAVAGVGALGLVALGAWVAAALPAGALEGNLMPFNALGVVGPEVVLLGRTDFHLRQLSPLPISVLAAGVLVAGGVVAAGSRRLALVGLGVALVASSVAAHLGTARTFRTFWFGHLSQIVTAVEELDVAEDEPISYDTRFGRHQGRKVMQFWWGEDRLRPVSRIDDATELVVTRHPAMAEWCYSFVARDPVSELELWQLDEECLATLPEPGR